MCVRVSFLLCVCVCVCVRVYVRVLVRLCLGCVFDFDAPTPPFFFSLHGREFGRTKLTLYCA